MNRVLLFYILIISQLLIAETTSDTSFYPSNGAIKSISTYENYRIQHYIEYYSNGDKKYTVDYSYENDTLRRESLKRANEKEFAYGEYRYSELGYTYDYYHTSGKKLMTSDYSLFGYLVRKTKLLPNGKTYWRTEYTYDSLGWLLDEDYFGKKDTLEATARWSYDSTSKVTTYHYQLRGDSLLVNQYTGDVYDEYKTFYSTSLSQKDSTQVFYNGELVYSSHFEWNEKGYLISDKHFDKEGNRTSTGTYTFNEADYTTHYRYQYESDSTIWETISDYRGVTKETNIYYGKALTSQTAYRYNDLLYTDSTLYYDAEEALLAFGKYTYYEPYEWVKTYLYAYPNGDTISYVEYNEDGSISKIVATDPILHDKIMLLQLTQRGTKLALTNLPASQGTYCLVSLQGKVLQQGKWQQQNQLTLETGGFAQGIYLLHIQTDKLRHTLPVRLQ